MIAARAPATCACGMIECVCRLAAQHPDPKCRFRVALLWRVPIECQHGFDVCPDCDPCTCRKEATP